MSPAAERQDVTLVVDGLEVTAPNGTMLVDAAKQGDVEIPVFCYEPKLGQPVGACRMCLVEVEGIPKLQTACSTPIRDGMVVYTRTDRVKEAQSAVVEFLLVNHPLDCPVCDKGGECPLQDIAMGWGPGRSRMTDPKRHFQKPIPLSPLVRIDRERCILCYRCVRFSQEVSEDEQLQLLERGARTYVGTFDDRPYIAPFHGNIIELCPVGALTSESYRFRARPWDIEDAGSVCTLCPSQCNVKFTVRDERVARVLARDNHDVDDGWLCDKGRFGFEMMASEERITQPMIRSGGALRAVGWEEALEAAASGLRAAGSASAAIAGGGTSNEEGYLIQRIMRGALGSPHVDSRALGAAERGILAELSRPELGATVADIDAADSILVLGVDLLHSMPILDLRVRKAVRRTDARAAVATERPTTLDGGADETARYAPGEAAAFLWTLASELGVADAPVTETYRQPASEVAGVLRPGRTVLIFGERLVRDPDALLACAGALKLDAEGAGLIEVPDSPNARGLREAGMLPDAGPGFAEVAPGAGSAGIRDGLAAKELHALLLANANPARELPDTGGWAKALKSSFVVAFSSFEDESAKHADVIFPAETHAEKEGTVVHPDGRIQRLRPSVPHPGDTRPGWQILAELAARLGDETQIDSASEALEQLASEVPFYAGLTLEEIGGRGVRWQEREAAKSFPTESPQPGSDPRRGSDPTGAANRSDPTGQIPSPSGTLRLGTYRDLWADEATDRNPSLRFLAPKQTVEIAPSDAEELGLEQGDEVDVKSNDTSVRARVAIRERVRPGSAFMIEATVEANANQLSPAEAIEVVKAGKPAPTALGREAEEAVG
ncbi:MAG: NADH-quinone oxidoreductase subunit NuoG [Solirubrobacterales bacterium]